MTETIKNTPEQLAATFFWESLNKETARTNTALVLNHSNITSSIIALERGISAVVNIGNTMPSFVGVYTITNEVKEEIFEGNGPLTNAIISNYSVRFLTDHYVRELDPNFDSNTIRTVPGFDENFAQKMRDKSRYIDKEGVEELKKKYGPYVNPHFLSGVTLCLFEDQRYVQENLDKEAFGFEVDGVRWSATFEAKSVSGSRPVVYFTLVRSEQHCSTKKLPFHIGNNNNGKPDFKYMHDVENIIGHFSEPINPNTAMVLKEFTCILMERISRMFVVDKYVFEEDGVKEEYDWFNFDKVNAENLHKVCALLETIATKNENPTTYHDTQGKIKLSTTLRPQDEGRVSGFNIVFAKIARGIKNIERYPYSDGVLTKKTPDGAFFMEEDELNAILDDMFQSYISREIDIYAIKDLSKFSFKENNEFLEKGRVFMFNTIMKNLLDAILHKRIY